MTTPTPTPAPSHLSPTTPNFPIFWDSTMLGTLKECGRKFYYEHILGFHSRGVNLHLYFGLLFHSGMERYDHSLAAGTPHREAVREMVRWVLCNSGTRADDGTWTAWAPLDRDGKPEAYKNRYTLIRSLVWSVEEHAHSPLRTVIKANGKPAVEESFRFPAFTVGDEQITLCGHLDRIVEMDGAKWVYDHKTTKGALNAQYFRGFTPHNQFTLYTIAGKIILDESTRGVLVSGVQIGVGFTRFATAQVPRPAAVLTEWLTDAQYWIGQAREFALRDHWPANDKSCGNYGGCPFQRVCALSPSHRKAWLDEDYERWSWNPLIVRGDV